MKKLSAKEELGILPLKEREALKDKWLDIRLSRLIPELMAKHKVDMWIMGGREYNEDPLLETFFPSSIDSSRRLTLIVFSLQKGKEAERLVIHQNPEFKPFYHPVWNIQNEDQWQCLERIIKERNPERIALNVSGTHAVCDGLSHSLFEKIRHYIHEAGSPEIVSAEAIAVEWLETRLSEELETYGEIAEMTRRIAAESFTAIIPGITSTRDAVDWIRQRVLDLGLKTSFYPTVDVQRKGSMNSRMSDTIIREGDIVHLDFGIHYLGFSTDTQLLAYAASEGIVPRELQGLMEKANRLEDIIGEQFILGRTGNQIFEHSLEQAKKEGLQAMIYSHPLGYQCHGAGPIIGLYDQQGPVPIRGEYPLRDHTCFALEFNLTQFIEGWGQDVIMYMEESAAFMNGKLTYLTRRQKEFYLIPGKF
ncbi:M24 family metallopeptidase [Peribacillus kribbensis]|uniref:M24 family metallopeptidase n=1 Tax=Peribacillus kribbensis TaxID=356658 RepID=UPI0004079B7A|nr:M24 family metallopeptidase [Peribacillus kribbensis]